MIYFEKGDILYSDCTDIIHQANCFNTMGTGIARKIALKYPLAELVDKQTKKGDRTKLGTWSMSCTNGVTIYNCYMQYAYGRDKRYTSYDAMADCFTNLNNVFKNRTQPYKLGIPFNIGCVNAGGDWEIVNKIISVCFKNIDVYIWKLDN